VVTTVYARIVAITSRVEVNVAAGQVIVVLGKILSKKQILGFQDTLMVYSGLTELKLIREFRKVGSCELLRITCSNSSIVKPIPFLKKESALTNQNSCT